MAEGRLKRVLRGAVRGLMRAVMMMVLFVATCSGLTLGLASVLDSRRGDDVSYPPPETFPVIVVTNADGGPRARALYHREMDEFRRANPGYSFLIPDGQEERLLEQIKDESRVSFPVEARYDDPEIQWNAGFEVLEREAGEQYIRAYRTFDDDRVNEGWYRATAEGYFPRRHNSYFGPSAALGAGVMAMFVTLLLFLGYGALKGRDALRGE